MKFLSFSLILFLFLFIKAIQSITLKCSEEGLFAHPTNCNRFYRCVESLRKGRFQSFSMSCGTGLSFDVQDQTCKFAAEVQTCGRSSSPSPSSSSSTSSSSSSSIRTDKVTFEHFEPSVRTSSFNSNQALQSTRHLPKQRATASSPSSSTLSPSSSPAPSSSTKAIAEEPDVIPTFFNSNSESADPEATLVNTSPIDSFVVSHRKPAQSSLSHAPVNLLNDQNTATLSTFSRPQSALDSSSPVSLIFLKPSTLPKQQQASRTLKANRQATLNKKVNSFKKSNVSNARVSSRSLSTQAQPLPAHFSPFIVNSMSLTNQATPTRYTHELTINHVIEKPDPKSNANRFSFSNQI